MNWQVEYYKKENGGKKPFYIKYILEVLKIQIMMELVIFQELFQN